MASIVSSFELYRAGFQKKQLNPSWYTHDVIKSRFDPSNVKQALWIVVMPPFTDRNIEQTTLMRLMEYCDTATN